MQNLIIKTTIFDRNSSVECATIKNSLKKAKSIDISEYNCFICNKNSIGSFVFIEKTIEKTQLSICDVEIFGHKIRNNGKIFSFFFRKFFLCFFFN